VADIHRQESGSLRMAKAAAGKVRIGRVSFSIGGLSPSVAREKYLMSLPCQCLLFVLLLIAALLSAVLRFVPAQITQTPSRQKQLGGYRD